MFVHVVTIENDILILLNVYILEIKNIRKQNV